MLDEKQSLFLCWDAVGWSAGGNYTAAGGVPVSLREQNHEPVTAAALQSQLSRIGKLVDKTAQRTVEVDPHLLYKVYKLLLSIFQIKLETQLISRQYCDTLS